MKRIASATTHLRDMNQQRALAYCANITASVWCGTGLDNDQIVKLWTLFRAYILNDYQDTNTPVPAEIYDVWARCKVIIDREVMK